MLAMASARGDIVEIDKILAKGANINFQGREGMTALIWALLHQNKRGYQHLLERGADPNLAMTKSTITSDGITDGNAAISLAAMHEDPWYLEITLKHGGNPNLYNEIKGETPLFQCIAFYDNKHTRLEQLKLLIAAGANLNAFNKNGATPIRNAILANRFDMIYIMLKAGADPNIINKAGTSIGSIMKNIRTDPNSELYQWRIQVEEMLHQRHIDVEMHNGK